jgi:uncharacterized membrane protein
MASRKTNTLVLASAVAGLLAMNAFGAPSTAKAGEEGKVHCYGVNTCKGTGACGGKGHSCAGQNACKGQGFLELEKDACLKQGGRLTPDEKK